MYIELIRNELLQANQLLNDFLNDDNNLVIIQNAAKVMANALKKGNKILSCGNGGSHCDAMHFAEELTGRYRNDRPGYAAIAISDVSHITCVGNDFGYENIFSRYVESVGNSKDILIGISTSGQSESVIRAFEEARSKGITTIALSGKDGGRMSGLADLEIRVPYFGYADRTQEMHIKIIHILIMLIEQFMSDDNFI